MSEKVIIKICAVCGGENDLENETCDLCGAPLDDAEQKEIEVVKETPAKEAQETPKPEKKIEKKPAPKTENKKKQPKKEESKSSDKKKEIGGTKVYYLIGALVVIGAVIIFASGIFDEPAPVFQQNSQSNSSNMPNDHNHDGVDLSAVQQINDMENALKQNPNDHDTLLRLAHLLNDSGFYDRAIVKYKEYLNAHPENADVLVDLGVCYFSIKDYPNAEKYMKQAIKVSPKHQIANFNLGIVAINQNKNKEAVNYWNKAIELNPTTDIASKAKDLINQYQ